MEWPEAWSHPYRGFNNSHWESRCFHNGAWKTVWADTEEELRSLVDFWEAKFAPQRKVPTPPRRRQPIGVTRTTPVYDIPKRSLRLEVAMWCAIGAALVEPLLWRFV